MPPSCDRWSVHTGKRAPGSTAGNGDAGGRGARDAACRRAARCTSRRRTSGRPCRLLASATVAAGCESGASHPPAARPARETLTEPMLLEGTRGSYQDPATPQSTRRRDRAGHRPATQPPGSSLPQPMTGGSPPRAPSTPPRSEEGEKTSSRSSLSQTQHSKIFQPRFPASRPRVYVKRHSTQSPTQRAM